MIVEVKPVTVMPLPPMFILFPSQKILPSPVTISVTIKNKKLGCPGDFEVLG